MSKEAEGGGTTGPSAGWSAAHQQLLGLEASNLEHREEDQQERWSLRERKQEADTQTDERGPWGQKECLTVRCRLLWSLVSDGQTEAGRGTEPDGLLD